MLPLMRNFIFMVLIIDAAVESQSWDTFDIRNSVYGETVYNSVTYETTNNCIIKNIFKNQSREDYPDYYDAYGRIRKTRYWDTIPLYKHATCEVTAIAVNQLPAYNNPKNLTSILFKNSNISLIPVGVLNVYTDLTSLYINNTNVKTIYPGAFTYLNSLKELHLEYNYINKITKGIFNSLPSLEKLYLNSNNISLIEEHAFLGMFELNELNLGYNILKYLFPDAFLNLDKLKKINLSHNNLLEVIIEYFPCLTDLDISYNKLHSFNFSVLSSNITQLNLKNNDIKFVSWTEDTQETVSSVDLSHNKVSKLDYVESHAVYLNFSGNDFFSLEDSTLFNKSHVLEILDFSNNKIHKLGTDVFAELRSLRSLYIQKNFITDIPIGCFRNLKKLNLLNLSNNDLTYIEYGTFTGLSQIIYFDISNNKLSFLHESSLQPLKNLNELRISGNLLTQIDPYDLSDISKNLRYVSLNNNPWSCQILSKVIKTLEKKGVIIEEGPNRQETNIHGIVCQKSAPEVISHPSSINDSTQETAKNIYALSGAMNNIRKYFNEDFLTSEFYKYFENFKIFNPIKNISKSYIDSIKLADNVFASTKLYNFFNSDTLKSNPFQQLVTDLMEITKSLNNTKIFYTNISEGGYLDRNTNSNELEMLNTSFEKKVNDIFAKIDSSFDKILNNSLLINFFKNISDYNTAEMKHYATVYEERMFTPLPENTKNVFFTDRSPGEILDHINKLEIRQEELFGKNEKVSSAAFFSVIIVILLAVVFLMAFNHFAVNSSRMFCRKWFTKSVTDNTSNFSNSRIEMV